MTCPAVQELYRSSTAVQVTLKILLSYERCLFGPNSRAVQFWEHMLTEIYIFAVWTK